MNFRKYIPNGITFVRIALTLALIFVVPCSIPFFILYTFCGITDVLDGWLARRWKVTSDFGSRLDSVADLTFYTVALVRLVPILKRVLPIFVWCFIAGILALRAVGYLVVFLKYHRFAAVHTYANKTSGLAVFTVPFWVLWADMGIVGTVICAVSGYAAAEELWIHLAARDYDPSVKAFWQLASRQKTKEA